jgi:hypothetical protein
MFSRSGKSTVPKYLAFQGSKLKAVQVPDCVFDDEFDLVEFQPENKQDRTVLGDC